MKTTNDYSRLLCMAIVTFCLVFTCSCGDDKKDDPVVKAPTLTTAEASAITAATATSGGNVTSDGGSEVTARGVCWGVAASPTTDGSKTTDGKGTGSLTSSLTGLTANTKYYVRAYAVNSAGTAYGNEVSFTTTAQEPGTIAPELTTAEVSVVTATTATAGGNITNAGTPSYTERGVCYAVTANPTTANTKVAVAGTGTGDFTANLTGLTAGAKYYVRAYAVYSGGTVYGNEVSFTAQNQIAAPVLTTSTVIDISATIATAGGRITNVGIPAFTGLGICYATTANPTTANSKVTYTFDEPGVGPFTVNLTGLTANTKYYVRAYAVTSAGVTYGNEVSFTTSSAGEDPTNPGSELLLEAVYSHSEEIGENLVIKYEYDNQGRIVKVTRSDRNYETITYDASGGLTTQGLYNNEPYTTTYTKDGNTIVDGDGFSTHTLNDQGLPTESQYDNTKYTYTYDSKGNSLYFYGSSYDNKKGPLSSCTSPKWYLFLFIFYERPFLAGYVNNPLSIGDVPYAYEYNAAGYPARVNKPYGGGYYTFTYKEK